MIKALLARMAVKRAAELTVKRQMNVALVMGLTRLLRNVLGRLEVRFPQWKFLGYRKYIGL